MQKPLRKTTARLIAALWEQYQNALQAVISDAVTDGEVPPGTRCVVGNGQAVWEFDDPAVVGAIPQAEVPPEPNV